MGNLELDLKTPRSYQNVDSPGANYAIEGLCQRVKSTTSNTTSSRIGFSERVSANLCYFNKFVPKKKWDNIFCAEDNEDITFCNSVYGHGFIFSRAYQYMR